MTPEYLRTLRSHAEMVRDRLDRALQLDTPLRREQFEWAEKQFADKYPHYNWREWAEKEKPVQR